MAIYIMHAVVVKNVNPKCSVTWILLQMCICMALVSICDGSCYSKSNQWSSAVKMWGYLLSCVQMTLVFPTYCICPSSAKVNVNHVEDFKIHVMKRLQATHGACLFLHTNCIYVVHMKSLCNDIVKYWWRVHMRNKNALK